MTSIATARAVGAAERIVQEMAFATTTSNAMAAVMPVEGSAGMEAKALKAV